MFLVDFLSLFCSILYALFASSQKMRFRGIKIVLLVILSDCEREREKKRKKKRERVIVNC